MKTLIKHWFFLGVLLVSYTIAVAQQRKIDSSVYRKWPLIELKYGTTISNDGNFVIYKVQNQPVGSYTVIIQGIHNNWRKELPGAKNCTFSDDSKSYIFFTNDSLHIGTLGKPDGYIVKGVASFMRINKQTGGDWLWLRYTKDPNDLVLRDLQTGSEVIYSSITNFWMDRLGKHVLFDKILSNHQHELQWLEPGRPTPKTIWIGTISGRPVWNLKGDRLGFLGIGGKNVKPSIFIYQEGEETCIELKSKDIDTLSKKYDIAAVNAITTAGDRVFFSLVEKSSPETSKSSLGLDVYSYRDPILQSEQLIHPNPRPFYTAIFNTDENHVMMIEGKGIKLVTPREDLETSGEFVLIDKLNKGTEEAGTGERNWSPYGKSSVYLFSLVNGSLRNIYSSLQNLGLKKDPNQCRISPDGKYVVWFYPEDNNYYSYCISTHILNNLTHTIHSKWYSGEYADTPFGKYNTDGFAGFLKEKATVLLYGQYDIYAVDLAGKKAPACLTNGEGAKRRIKFRLASYDVNNVPVISFGRHLVVNAFDFQTKANGYYLVDPSRRSAPQYLSMQPCVFSGITGTVTDYTIPIKARNSESYIVQRQTESDAPNLYYTADFKEFIRLTDVQPQRGYNWLTSHLVNWKTFDGTTSHGILYRPTNFDPGKKYPVIFFYYEKFSNSLHRFIYPEANGATIDIPSYVSDGYVVFVPDIHYQIGNPGKSAYNSVVSAAQYLSKMPWVDRKRMGINGHSFGGYETEYLITHTLIFKAACAASGWSNFISAYDGIKTSGNSRQDFYETFRERMGGTLWDIPQSYIAASPIFRADRVSTPLLMMNNKGDNDVHFYLGTEFFVALRRLQKKVWMLQYDDEGHLLFKKDAVNDLSIRMKQFFDHYLKGAPPPNWMTRGIPAKLKGIDDGLTLDTSGAQP